MQYNFDIEEEFSGLLSSKWNFRREKVGREDVLPMWIADMDFAGALPIKQAIVRRAECGLYGYAGVTQAYIQAVINWFSRRHQWTIQPEAIMQTPGVVSALHIGIQAFSAENDYILIQPPVYHPFFRAIRGMKRRVLENSLVRTDTGYEIDFADFERKVIQHKPKIFILCNPHNPTGRVYTKTELERLGYICQENQVLIIADEIHCDIVYHGARHIPFATVSPECKENAIVCTAPSKTFNLAGLRNSNIVIPGVAIREKFRAAFEYFGYPHPSLFPLIAGEAAYTQGEAWLEQAVAYIERNRDYALARLHSSLPSLAAARPQGTYFLWLDFGKYGLNGMELERFLLNRARVWLNQGYIFGEAGNGFARMNIACPRSILEKALTQIETALRELT